MQKTTKSFNNKLRAKIFKKWLLAFIPQLIATIIGVVFGEIILIKLFIGVNAAFLFSYTFISVFCYCIKKQ